MSASSTRRASASRERRRGHAHLGVRPRAARARIGADCNICDHVFIENDVVVGDRVTVKCGVQLWDGVAARGRRLHRPERHLHQRPVPAQQGLPRERSRTTVVRQGASIGANATILPGVTIGADAMVGAGSVVTRDVPRERHRRRQPGADRRATRTPTVAERRGRRRAVRGEPASSVVDGRAARSADRRGRPARQPRRGRVRGRPAVRAAALLRRLRRALDGRARRARAPGVRAVPGRACAGSVSAVVDDGAPPRGVPARPARRRPLHAGDGLGHAVPVLARRRAARPRVATRTTPTTTSATTTSSRDWRWPVSRAP